MLLYFVVFYAVGNKDDIVSKKVILTSDAKKLAEQLGIQLFETSARDGKNIEEVRIDTAIDHVVSKHEYVMHRIFGKFLATGIDLSKILRGANQNIEEDNGW